MITLCTTAFAAVTASTGVVKWTQPLAPNVVVVGSPLLTPVCVAYFASDGRVRCVTADSGALVWTSAPDAIPLGDLAGALAYHAERRLVLLALTRVYLRDGVVSWLALSVDDGSLAWYAQTGQPEVYATASAPVPMPGALIATRFTSDPDSPCALEAHNASADFAFLWTVGMPDASTWPGPTWGFMAAPAYSPASDTVYAMTTSGILMAVAGGTGAVRWTRNLRRLNFPPGPRRTDIVVTPSAAAGRDGRVYCCCEITCHSVDAATGAHAEWSRSSAGSNFWSAPAVAPDGTLYVTTAGGEALPALLAIPPVKGTRSTLLVVAEGGDA